MASFQVTLWVMARSLARWKISPWRMMTIPGEPAW